jgi:hypothetical protein
MRSYGFVHRLVGAETQRRTAFEIKVVGNVGG